MYRFAVFDEDGPARKWPLIDAHLLGPDDLPIRGAISFKRGEILCKSPEAHALALCLQHECGPMGRLMLPTCLLPPRTKPYLLTVELARHRIKSFIAKSEEWQMFDLDADHPAMRHWEEARRRLTSALTSETPEEADRHATESLRQAIQASERLAMAHAEILLHRRYANRAASSATLGVRVWPARDGKALRDVIASNFDLIVMPLRWRDLEVEEGVYNWAPVDRWMEWAKAEGKPIVAGPLIDFSRAAVPPWMEVWQHDYDTCRDFVYDHIQRVVTRYRGIVGMWNIASGVNTNEHFEFNANQMVGLVRTANLLVRQLRPGARTMVELVAPFGEHCATRKASVPPLAFVDRLVQEGIKFDALGVQLLFGEHGNGRTTRDLMLISSLLDRFFLLELPILVSALGVPSRQSDPNGGWWHAPWDADRQSRWVSRMFAIALSKPFVESIFWTDLYDHPDARLRDAGLIDEEGKPKPALKRLVGARRRLRKPLGVLGVPAGGITS